MEFRPCIDIHNGKVKQIVGGSLKDEGNMADENFVSGQDAVFYANLYKKEGFRGGHIILLNARDSEYYEATKKQAMGALQAYPGGLQIGGGITAENAEEILAKFDVIVDASDNFPTRYLLSDTCMKLGKPDVYGAICEFAGQVTVFASDGPCLRCLCPEAEDPSGNPNSAAYGVLGVIPGMIGCMQAAEVLKLLLGKGEPLIGKMLFIDAKTWSTDLIEVPVHPQCSCHAHTKVHRT